MAYIARHNGAYTLAFGAVVLLGLAACRRGDESRRRALEDVPARRLVGAWSARFVADPPADSGRPLLVRDAARPEVRGTIALVEDREGTSYPDLPDALHVGSYDVDFRPFGFDPRTPGEPSTAAATTAGEPGSDSLADSVVVVLAPAAGGRAGTRAVVMRGHFEGDSVVGRWRAGGAVPFGVRGSFVLRRLP